MEKPASQQQLNVTYISDGSSSGAFRIACKQETPLPRFYHLGKELLTDVGRPNVSVLDVEVGLDSHCGGCRTKTTSCLKMGRKDRIANWREKTGVKRGRRLEKQTRRGQKGGAADGEGHFALFARSRGKLRG